MKLIKFLYKEKFLRSELGSLSTSEKDEIIFQETRRLLVAELQNIVFSEYLPVLLGTETMERLGIDLDTGSKYNPSLDPSIMNEFATAAMRFGHSTVREVHKDNLCDQGQL